MYVNMYAYVCMFNIRYNVLYHCKITYIACLFKWWTSFMFSGLNGFPVWVLILAVSVSDSSVCLRLSVHLSVFITLCLPAYPSSFMFLKVNYWRDILTISFMTSPHQGYAVISLMVYYWFWSKRPNKATSHSLHFPSIHRSPFMTPPPFITLAFIPLY